MLAGDVVDGCVLEENRFTLLAPDGIGGSLEIAVADDLGSEIARELLYDPSDDDGRRLTSSVADVSQGEHPQAPVPSAAAAFGAREVAARSHPPEPPSTTPRTSRDTSSSRSSQRQGAPGAIATTSRPMPPHARARCSPGRVSLASVMTAARSAVPVWLQAGASTKPGRSSASGSRTGLDSSASGQIAAPEPGSEHASRATAAGTTRSRSSMPMSASRRRTACATTIDRWSPAVNATIGLPSYRPSAKPARRRYACATARSPSGRASQS